MKCIRFLGIVLTVFSVLTASAEALIVFSDKGQKYESLFISEVCAIIFGDAVSPSSDMMKIFMSLPAWIFFGSLGILMIFLSRMKKNRYHHNHDL